MKLLKIATFLVCFFFSALVVDTTEAAALHIIDVERELSTDCKTFTFNETPLQHNVTSGPDNYSAEDGESLTDYCASHDCCGGDLPAEVDSPETRAYICANWSTDPLVSYKLCTGSCHGMAACYGIAANSLAGTTVDIARNACQGNSTCNGIASNSKAKSAISIGEGSCNSVGSNSACTSIAYWSSAILNISIGKGSCLNRDSCSYAALYSTSLQYLRIGDGSCPSLYSCQLFAYANSLEEPVKNTKEIEIGSNSCTKDESCFQLASKGNSLTKVIVPNNECNTYAGCANCGAVSTFDGIFQPTEQCCSAVSNEYYSQKFDAACNVDGDYIPCTDDNSNTFLVWNDKSVTCAWLSPKNKKKARKRQANNCKRDTVKAMCQKTCATDDDSYSFTAFNGKTRKCVWLTKKNASARRRRYCKEDFDGGALVTACKKSCDLCLET